ncbi:hypothetical protein IVB03_02935 [Bradyrhizobium sp. 168]|uniref:hypothetical protein n=1 Tax=Bradyrhizobium sp. 168 TaxID=2782639 RepID=UPI001FFAC7A0|nr:hypothetical protein [Bradyrhizobium sp. 168]MCK1578563.1 hypothetical protein [Bradyrhizobium sp. 168]
MLLFSTAFALMESKSSEARPDMFVNLARIIAVTSLLVIGALSILGGDQQGAFDGAFGTAFDGSR